MLRRDGRAMDVASDSVVVGMRTARLHTDDRPGLSRDRAVRDAG
jgi:hypothetical protein